MITRRGLFGILAGAVAAPIVVRSGLLMPVKPLPIDFMALLESRMRAAEAVLLQGITQAIYSDDATPYRGGLASLVGRPNLMLCGPQFKQIYQSILVERV